jgi:excisionase family DNA binding protein
VIDINNSYDLLNLIFPGKFSKEDRLRPDDAPATAYLNLNEAAEYLGISPRRLKDLCREKRITFTKPHYRCFSFKKTDLDAYLDVYRSYRS